MIARGLMLTRLGLLRNDGLGDTLLALPAATAAKRYDKAIQVELVCDPAYVPLLRSHPDLDAAIPDPGGSSGSLARVLRERDYDAVVVLRPTWRNALAALRARVPVRVGTGLRAYGLLFNVRWYGHRKVNRSHEVDYNLELLERLLGIDPGHPQFYLHPPAEDEESAHRLLEEMEVDPGRPIVTIHPGSRGSALPWPVEHFAELARLLRREGLQVVVTGTAEESDLTSVVARVPGVADLTGRTTLGEAAWVYKESDTMVANSTGTLHLAAAVGTKVIGMYPAAEINSPVRWGPYGPGHKVFRGPVDNCPKCVGPLCPVYNCLEMVHPEQVLRVALGIVAQSPRRSRWQTDEPSGGVKDAPA